MQQNKYCSTINQQTQLIVAALKKFTFPSFLSFWIFLVVFLVSSIRPHCCVLEVKFGGSVAEWLACWTQAQKDRVQIAVATLSGNSLKQTVHTHHAFVQRAAKLVEPLLRVTGVTAGQAESNGSLPLGLWFTSLAGWLPRTRISSGTLCSVIRVWTTFTFRGEIGTTEW